MVQTEFKEIKSDIELYKKTVGEYAKNNWILSDRIAFGYHKEHYYLLTFQKDD